MRKKVILINLIIIFVLYLVFEVHYYRYFIKRIGFKQPFIITSLKKEMEFYPPERFKHYPENFVSTKRPILFLGCSYTYGELLKDNENISSRLEKMTNRFCYNWGVVGHGPASILQLLEIEKSEKLIETKPEYIIYTFMFHHPVRYYYWQTYNTYRRLDLIPFQKYNFMYKSWIYQYIKNVELDNYLNQGNAFELQLDLFFNIVKKIKQECNELFPKSKFVILIYDDINKNICKGIIGNNNENKENVDKLFKLMYSKEFKKQLEAMGIEVITTEELIGRKMNKVEDRVPNDPNYPHPSNSAWDEILPQLIKKLNL